MTTIDRRTRFAGPVEVMDPDRLFGGLADRLTETGISPARGVEHLGLPPLGLDVEGTVAHLVVRDGRLVVDDGDTDDGPRAARRRPRARSFPGVTSTFGLVMAGRVGTRRGSKDQFVAWEPALRAAIDGRPVHEPGSIELRDRDGAPLDLQRGFRVDEPREEIGRFLAEAGYLHLDGCSRKRRWPRCRRSSTWRWRRHAGRRRSWWARTDEGWYPRGSSVSTSCRRPCRSCSRPTRSARSGTHRRRHGAAAARGGRQRRRAPEEGRRRRRHVRRVLAQGLLDGRPLAWVLRPDRRASP